MEWNADGSNNDYPDKYAEAVDHPGEQAVPWAPVHALDPIGEFSLGLSASRTINGRDFVPSRKHCQEHFSTDSTARKPNRLPDG